MIRKHITILQIAEGFGIDYTALMDKLSNKGMISLDEAGYIRKVFFSECPLNVLFEELLPAEKDSSV